MSVWIAETLLASTLLMALVMLLRRPVTRWLGAGAAYMLWALPLARLALPPLPRGVAPATPLQAAVDQSGLATVLTLPAATAPAVGAATAFPWVELAIGAWMLGVGLFIAFHLFAYIRFRRLILRDAIPMGREGRISIVASPKATGPLAFGVLHPHVAVPLDFEARFDAQERAMALAHECAHHQRGDLLANMIALGMLALHWCNPIAWIAWNSYRADQELACDARVLARHGRDNAHAYGRAILKAASGRRVAAACHLNRLDTLKGRLKMLSTHTDSLHRISWGMAAVALVTAAGLALTASGSRAAREMSAITEHVQDASMARLASLVADAPPEPLMPIAAVAPTVPEAPAVPARIDHHDAVPPAPPAPPAPAADMVPPVPPAPPVILSRGDGRITIRHADGRREVHAIPSAADVRRMVPSAAELRRMVPVVDVRDGCEGDPQQPVSQRTMTLSDGRQKIRVRICNAAIARTSHQQASAERAAAHAEHEAALAEARAEREEALAEARIERAAALAEAHADRQEAMAEIIAARADMARDHSIPAAARAEALRNMDKAIARMKSRL
ncbi:MAG: M56 family metallopeptidase [Sphingobium sp.]|nr:M56 family metallopeptidase [Sphingobium sp.]